MRSVKCRASSQDLWMSMRHKWHKSREVNNRNGGQWLKDISIKLHFPVPCWGARACTDRGAFLINKATSPISNISPSPSEIEALHHAAAWQWRHSLNTSGGEKPNTVSLIQQPPPLHSPNRKQWWNSLYASKGEKEILSSLIQRLDWRAHRWGKINQFLLLNECGMGRFGPG